MKTTVKFVLSTLVAAAAMNSTALMGKEVHIGPTGQYADWNAAYQNTGSSDKIIVDENSGSVGYVGDSNNRNSIGRDVVIGSGSALKVQRKMLRIDKTITVEAGASFNVTPHSSIVNPYTHIDGGKLYVGESGGERATMDFDTNSVAVLWSAVLDAKSADIVVGDLGMTGTAKFTDSNISVNGVAAFGKGFLGVQEMENSVMNIKGHALRNENTYYSTEGTILHKLTMDNSSITVDDGVEGTVAEAVTIKNLTMKDGSALTVEAGTAVTVTGNFELNKSSLSVGMLANSGTITVSGESYLEATEITGNKIVVSKGATLTLSSSSLLEMVDNTANKGAGNIVFNKVDSQVKDVNEITLKNADGKAVELSSGTGTITVNVASEITDASEISVIEAVSGGVVLAAWSFDIDNGEGENKTGVTVTMDVGEGQVLESLRILHEENGEWTDVTSVVTDKKLENGKLSFTAKDFSGYAVATPEPSMFGLMAGLGALVLVGTRRRRK